MLTFLLVIISLTLVLVIAFRWKNSKFYKLGKLLKQHDMVSLPFLGLSYKFLGSDEDRMETFKVFSDAVLNSGGIFFDWFAYYPGIVVADPEIAEFTLRTCLAKNNFMVHVFKVFFGNSTIFAPVSIWRPRRKLMLPIFKYSNLKQFLEVFANQSMTMVSKIKPQIGMPIPMFDHMASYAMASVCETSLGVKLNSSKESNANRLAEAITEVTRLLGERATQPWFHIDLIYKNLRRYKTLMKHKQYMYDFSGQIVEAKRKQMKEGNNVTEGSNMKSVVELLIESSGDDEGYTDREIIEEVMTLIIAGTDTSSVGAAFTILLLAKHPEVQEKIYEELQQTFENDTQPVTSEHLLKLKYLEAVLKESLRLYPPAPVIGRGTHTEITLPSGVVLPENCGILIHIWAINRNPRFWGPDAAEFRPERFLEDNLKHPAQFIPFSFGPRNCIGYQYAMMSMKTVLATLLRQYEVLPVDPIRIHEPIRLKFGMMMKDVDNFMVKLKPRN